MLKKIFLNKLSFVYFMLIFSLSMGVLFYFYYVNSEKNDEIILQAVDEKLVVSINFLEEKINNYVNKIKLKYKDNPILSSDDFPVSIKILELNDNDFDLLMAILKDFQNKYHISSIFFFNNKNIVINTSSSDFNFIFNNFKKQIEELRKGTIFNSSIIRIYSQIYRISFKKIDRISFIGIILDKNYFSSYYKIKEKSSFLFKSFLLLYISLIIVFFIIFIVYKYYEKKETENKFKNEILINTGLMSSEIAHSIKNPVTIISLLAESLNDVDKSKSIKEECNRIIIMINNFLNLSKKIDVKYEKLMLMDLKNIITSNISVFDLDFKIEILKNSTIYYDKNLLLEIIDNLISNSLRYKSEKKVFVNINIKLKRNKLFIEYQDNGIGIKNHNISKIFNPFYTTSAEGTGLGLSKIKRIIDSGSGDIKVFSSGENNGTKFIIFLKIKRK